MANADKLTQIKISKILKYITFKFSFFTSMASGAEGQRFESSRARHGLICLLLAFSAPLNAESIELSPADLEALALGRGIMAIQQSLAHPTDPTSLEAIRELGTDSRHYTMVRGWLMQILVGDMSIVEADPDNIPQVIRERILFLQEAIRAIDLE